jgi:lipoprotein NlpI
LTAAPAAATAQAPVADPVYVCFEGTNNPELDIHYCSQAIEVVPKAGGDRATLLALRGRAYSAIARHDRAIDDFDAALKLNPISALALNSRGLALHAKGAYDQAIDDFDAAVTLFPRYYDAFRNRGTARFFSGDSKAAAADFTAALGIYDKDPASMVLRGLAHYFEGAFRAAAQDLARAREMAYGYPYLDHWLYLAREANGESGADALRAAAAETGAAWPSPLTAALLGHASDDEVLAALAAMPAPIRALRSVPARYFLGELARLRSKPATARRHFEAAFAAEGPRPIEWAGAKAALARY